MRDENGIFRIFIEGKIWPKFNNVLCHCLGGSWGRSGLQNDQGARSKMGGHLLNCGVDVLGVNLIAFSERSGHTHNISISLDLLRLRNQQSLVNYFLQHDIETRLNEWHLTAVD